LLGCVAGNGDKRAADFLTLLVSYLGEAETQSVRQYQGQSQEFAYTYDADQAALELEATAHERPLVFLFRGVELPASRGLFKTVAVTSLDDGPTLLPELASIDQVPYHRTRTHRRTRTRTRVAHVVTVVRSVTRERPLGGSSTRPSASSGFSRDPPRRAFAWPSTGSPTPATPPPADALLQPSLTGRQVSRLGDVTWLRLAQALNEAVTQQLARLYR
jgi:hypothetical protein